MTDLETRLRESFAEHRGSVVVDRELLDGAVRRGERRVRRQRAVFVGSVAVIILSVFWIGSIVDDQRSDVDVVPASGPVRDVGSVDQVPEGSDRIVVAEPDGESPGVFVLRDSSDQLVALSARAPKQGCRLLLAEAVDVDLGADVVFHDPCHGQNFDRAGLAVGGPGIRGMYRYDLESATGRLLVDTSLTYPGPFVESIEGGEMSLDRLGPSDEEAMIWLDAVEAAGDAVRHDGSGPFVWVLGAFHDVVSGVVTVPFTIDGLAGQVQVGPIDQFPERGVADGTRVGDPARHDLTAGTLFIPVPSLAGGDILQADMALDDGRWLRLGVLLPIEGPDLGDIVTLIDVATITATR